ncbi:tRNA (adenosine(37)-N6)-threonylcarbamoyltransferase complex dimerization subunit type 1 TsaB [Chelatococcus sp. SYSU_G07232]|uniref:tRNA (Adenosine(37)-N6)-threonylcarbamoyltransferase complex dimerization subunit type 1 TsaB n=1 Tax=Chelatococcus albus TaxID=3047466 RepID=A0ABT7AH99_9HYPH|nr:tRNA (adenosine(37)-N6)-threonylcarbamoyltransferase complex dimerization subunit type 1 TsaB [Chelatococcus sp. SYSU_G07232]MDJ1158744.1 tRNA (adenosine(37)-N6)-threonylcarbamoyltransferase complex dimerization subunit type 1 TsaB [Chelatococcus sp. SYSU_G07232]
MRVLAIDTALGACAACVLEKGAAEPLAHESLTIDRGHAEALLPLVERVVAHSEGGFAALSRVAVTVGPGSFTGLRVGIAAARAIGLAAKIPVVGVTTLSALLAPLVAREENRFLAAAIDARHGHVFFQVVAAGGRTVIPPRHLSVRDAARAIGAGPVTLSGSGAPAVAAEALSLGTDAVVGEVAPAPSILWVARLGLAADPAAALPKPFYLRSPDARPQNHVSLPRR